MRYENLDDVVLVPRPWNFTFEGLKAALWRRYFRAAGDLEQVGDIYYFPDGLLGRWAERRVLIDSDKAFARWAALDNDATGLPMLWEYPRFDSCHSHRPLPRACDDLPTRTIYRGPGVACTTDGGFNGGDDGGAADSRDAVAGSRCGSASSSDGGGGCCVPEIDAVPDDESWPDSDTASSDSSASCGSMGMLVWRRRELRVLRRLSARDLSSGCASLWGGAGTAGAAKDAPCARVPLDTAGGMSVGGS